MKYIPWILLGIAVYILIRMRNERIKTDWQVSQVNSKIPNFEKINAMVVNAIPDLTPKAFDYANSYLNS